MTQKAKSRRFSPSLDLHGTSVEGTEAPAALANLKMKARSVPTTVIRLDVWTPCGGSCMEAERSHGSGSIDGIGTDAITFDLGNPQDKDQCRLAHGFSCVAACNIPYLSLALDYKVAYISTKFSFPRPAFIRLQ
jgi:hypothetical protein